MRIKSQVSSEFMIVIVMTMLVLLVMSIIIYQKSIESFRFRIDLGGTRITNQIADNINQIGNVGIGYSQCFTLPAYITDREYRVRFYTGEATVFVEVGDPAEWIWSAPLFTSEVECTMDLCSIGTLGRQVDVWVSYEEDGIKVRDCGACGAPSGCNLI
ncbi:MAG: hypothetical protein V1921_09205 [Candidatus Altiarchaeota archaeon]